MAVEIINPINDGTWDQKMLACPGGTFFHSRSWARVLVDSYGYTPLYFTILDGERIAGLLPVMEVDSRLTGKRGVSLPFTDYCEPIAPDHGTFQTLFDAATAYGRERQWKYLELRGGAEHLTGNPASGTFLRHTLNLAPGEKALHAALRDSTRRNIKRGKTAEVEVVFSDSADAIRQFYRLNGMTRKEHGLPPQPFRFFEKLHEHVIAPGLGMVALAMRYGKAVAGAVYFRFGGEAIYKYGASDRSLQHIRANNLVMWEAIRRFANEGCTRLCLGRTELEHEGLRQFKTGWGTDESEIVYHRYDMKKQAFAANHFRSASSVQTKVMSRMPVPVLNALGSLLYKHMG
jgi:Acetyltransferase (GNAT) domain